MKFFFDNGLSPRLAAAFRVLLESEGHVVEHIHDRFPHDIADIDWIRALAREEGWIVISRDARLLKNPHERQALAEAGLIVFVLATGWHHQKRWSITWNLMRWWERIMRVAAQARTGTVYKVPFRYSEKPDSIKRLL